MTSKIVNLSIKYMQTGYGTYYPVYRASERFLDRYMALEHTEQWKETANLYFDLFLQQWTKMKAAGHNYGVNNYMNIRQMSFEGRDYQHPLPTVKPD